MTTVTVSPLSEPMIDWIWEYPVVELMSHFGQSVPSCAFQR